MGLNYSREDIKDSMSGNIENIQPLVSAMKSGNLIVFVGAGMSVHLGVPGWRGFALKYLDLIYDNRIKTLMNYKTKESLKQEDTKKLLSICKYISQQKLAPEKVKSAYKEWFTVDKDKLKDKKLYQKLYDLSAIYITTNYDNALDILAEEKPVGDLSIDSEEENKKTKNNENGKVYYNPEMFNEDILRMGNVVHIHGSIQEPSTMVISYEDYINKYGLNNGNESNRNIQQNYSEFLSEVFKGDNVILFIGYGLEEFEILQYMFDDKLVNENYQKRYLLLACYCDDYFKISYISNYYKKYYGINVIPYDITENGYDKLEEVLDTLRTLKNSYSENECESVKSKELKEAMWMIKEL